MLIINIWQSCLQQNPIFWRYFHACRQNYYVREGRGYAGRSVCHLFRLSVCLSVCLDYCKSNQPISLKLGVMTRPTNRKNWVTFGGDLVWIRILDHFSTFLAIAESGILGDLLAFPVQSPADFYDTLRSDWCRQDNESTTFGSNLAVWTQILAHFWLRLDTLVEV